METVLEETVSSEDLKRFEQKYHTELQEGKVTVHALMFNGQFSNFTLRFNIKC